MKAPPAGADRRAFGRRPTYQHGSVLIAGRAALRCVVRDISLGGALLEFGEPVSLPSRVRVVWDGTEQSAQCEVRHVQGHRAGVQFICDVGPRIARETLALGLTDTPPPTPAPALERSQAKNGGLELVHKFRDAGVLAKTDV